MVSSAFALTLAFEVSTRDRENCWMRMRGTITDWWSGKRRDIDDEISLVTVRHPGGGRRWCFVACSPGWGVVKAQKGAILLSVPICQRECPK